MPKQPANDSERPAATREDETARSVLRSLRRILQAVDQHGRRLKSRYGLTGPQIICLREIQRGASLNPGQLARNVGLKPPTVTGIVDRLEARGLVTRRRRNTDKRQVRIELTEAGTAVVNEAPAPLQEEFVGRFATLPAERREAIADHLDEVVALLEAEGIEAAPLLAHGSANPDVNDLPVEPQPAARRRGGRTA
ncbi:MarR family winged helix-turn-helix transcriptional regulator [Halofilum ochraceum]|uniref:MarR family winged helix-turn-helix transcriptional regulator n=1 Tax=Halofilum ochraceum TaxID=1611323 RepID=UPI0008D9D9BE|nr:MarR family transcriptional regulator [Halofilum ochraceum]